MSERDTLRAEYLQRVCTALGEYMSRGLPLQLQSDGNGDTLEVTFTIDNPDTFHALLEGHAPPTPAGGSADAPSHN